MKTKVVDIMTLLGEVDAVCVTTNGWVKNDGACVMGRGIAYEFKRLFPKLPYELGRLIREKGNVPHVIGTLYGTTTLISFPTKPSSVVNEINNVIPRMRTRYLKGQKIPGWAAMSDLSIIENSCKLLVDIVDDRGFNNVYLPRPGCGNGELIWGMVEPIIKEYLDDRFIVCALSDCDFEKDNV